MSEMTRMGRQLSFTFADFFAGIGLVRMGLEPLGGRCVFANDIDPIKFRMYASFFGHDGYLLRDIHAVSAADVVNVDLAHASFPCTDVSLAGPRTGLDGKQTSVVWEFVRILTELRDAGRLPRIVTLENVTGWLSLDGGRHFHRLIAVINALGYVCDAFVVDAKWFVPQSRPRLFVVCHLGRHPAMRSLNTVVEQSRLVRPRQLVSFMYRSNELAWGILPIPGPPSCSTRLEDILESLPVDHPEWWPPDKVEKLLAQMHSYQRSLIEQARGLGETRILTVYRRTRKGAPKAEVRADGIAGCLRTARGGSSRQIVVVVQGGRVRARFMTPREYARLQGVPDHWPISVPTSHALHGFGDGVCVPAVTWIGQYVLAPLLSYASESASYEAWGKQLCHPSTRFLAAIR